MSGESAASAPATAAGSAGVPLAVEEVTAEGRRPESWAWFLHGIFGAGRNWRSTARRLVDARPDWGGLLVDLRLHGASGDAPPPHTLAACARDLRTTVEAGAPPPRVLLGHSFGGKVALEAAAAGPTALDEVWVLDATPSPAEPGGAAVEMLEAIRRRPGPFDDREDARAALAAEGFPPRVRRWMSTNLREAPDGLRWRLDPDGMEALLGDFFARDLWEVVENPPADVAVHLVQARASDVLGEEDVRRASAAAERHARVELHRLEGGHWLHVSNPDGLLELLQRRMTR